ncbi:MAG: beta strand repeat-containing protein [Halobacteriales archaeon]
MSRRPRSLVLGIAIGLLGLVLTVGAIGVGGVEVSPDAPTQISGCTTIDTPGDYELTADVVDSNASTCIEITSDNVTLDGRGYSIDGVNASFSHGVQAGVTTAVTNVTVEDLAVADWAFGVSFQSVTDGTIESVDASENDIGVQLGRGQDVLIDDTTTTDNGNWGIAARGTEDVLVRESTVSDNADGIEVSSRADDVTIHDVNVTGSTGMGVRVGAATNTTIDLSTIVDQDTGVAIVGSDASDAVGTVLRDLTVAQSSTADVRVDVRATDTSFDGLILTSAVLSGTAARVELGAPSSLPAVPTGQDHVNQFLALEEVASGGYLDATFHYDPSAVGAIDESTLTVHRHDGSWTAVSGSTVDPTADTVSGNVTASATSEVVAPLGDVAGSDITDCLTITQSGSYDVTGDITTSQNVCIDVQADDVHVDGGGHTITGTMGTAAIQAIGRSNVSVSNLDLEAWMSGAEYLDVVDGDLSDVEVTSSDHAVNLQGVTDVHIANVTALGTADTAGQMRSSQDVIVSDLTVDGANGHGLEAVVSQGVTVVDASVTNVSDDGLRFDDSDDVAVAGGTVTMADRGLLLAAGTNASVDGMTASDNGDGAVLDGWQGGTLESVNASTNGDDGLRITDTRDVAIDGGTFDANGVFGISLVESATGGAHPTTNNTLLDLAARDNGDWDVGNHGHAGGNDAEAVDLDTATVSFVATDVHLRGEGAPPADPADYDNVDAYLRVAESAPGGTVDLNVSYDPATVAAAGVDEPTLGLMRHDGTWTDVTPTGVDVGAQDAWGELTGIAAGGEPVGVFGTDDPSLNDDCFTVTDPGSYTVTADISTTQGVCIDVQADDVHIDGGGHLIDHQQTGHRAVEAINQSNVSVSNLTVSSWVFGASFHNVDDGTITDMQATNTVLGFDIENANDVNLSDVGYANGHSGSQSWTSGGDSHGIRVRLSDAVSIDDATVTDSTNAGVVIFDSSGTTLSTLHVHDVSGHGFVINQATNVSATDVEIDNADDAGLRVDGSTDAGVTDFEISGSEEGVLLDGGELDLLQGLATDNAYGLRLESADHSVTNVTLEDNDYGVYSDATGGTTFNGVVAEDNDWDAWVGGLSSTQSAIDDLLVGDTLVQIRGIAAGVRTAGTVPGDPSGMNNLSTYLKVRIDQDNWAPDAHLNLTVSFPIGPYGLVEDGTVSGWEHNGSWSELPAPNEEVSGVNQVNMSIDHGPFQTARLIGLFGEEDPDGSPIPGFAPTAAILALLAIAMLGRRLSDRL